MKRVLTVLSISLLITAVFSGCDKTERKCMNGYVYELPENGTHWMVNGDKCGERAVVTVEEDYVEIPVSSNFSKPGHELKSEPKKTGLDKVDIVFLSLFLIWFLFIKENKNERV